MRKVLVVALGWTCTAGSCVERIQPELISTEIVRGRPAGIYGPVPVDTAETSRRVALKVKKSEVEKIFSDDINLVVDMTDCSGTELHTDALYVGGKSTHEMLLMTKKEFGEFASLLPSSFEAATYIPERLFLASAHLCIRLMGGNMVATRVEASEIRVK